MSSHTILEKVDRSGESSEKIPLTPPQPPDNCLSLSPPAEEPKARETAQEEYSPVHDPRGGTRSSSPLISAAVFHDPVAIPSSLLSSPQRNEKEEVGETLERHHSVSKLQHATDSDDEMEVAEYLLQHKDSFAFLSTQKQEAQEKQAEEQGQEVVVQVPSPQLSSGNALESPAALSSPPAPAPAPQPTLGHLNGNYVVQNSEPSGQKQIDPIEEQLPPSPKECPEPSPSTAHQALPPHSDVNSGENIELSSPAVPPHSDVNSGETIELSSPAVPPHSDVNSGETIELSSPAVPPHSDVNSGETNALSSPAVPPHSDVNSGETIELSSPAVPPHSDVNSGETIELSSPAVPPHSDVNSGETNALSSPAVPPHSDVNSGETNELSGLSTIEPHACLLSESEVNSEAKAEQPISRRPGKDEPSSLAAMVKEKKRGPSFKLLTEEAPHLSDIVATAVPFLSSGGDSPDSSRPSASGKGLQETDLNLSGSERLSSAEPFDVSGRESEVDSRAVVESEDGRPRAGTVEEKVKFFQNVLRAHADSASRSRTLSREQVRHEADKLKHFQRLGQATVVNQSPLSSPSSSGSTSSQGGTPVSEGRRHILSNVGGAGRGRGRGSTRTAVTMSAQPNHQRNSFDLRNFNLKDYIDGLEQEATPTSP
eukprot:gene7101-7853_t